MRDRFTTGLLEDPLEETELEVEVDSDERRLMRVGGRGCSRAFEL